MVNESVVFRPDTEHTKSMDVTLEKFYPSNGTKFTKDSPFIEIPITVRKNGFLVPAETTLNFTWRAQPNAAAIAANNYDIYASTAGSHALLNKVTLHQGSNELECVSDWNRLHANMKVLYEDPYQANGNGSVRDPVLSCPCKSQNDDGTFKYKTTTTGNKQGAIFPQCRTVGINLNLDADGNCRAAANPPATTTENSKAYSNYFKCSLSLSALDLLGSSAQKLLPLSVANDFRLRIHLEKDIYKCYYADRARIDDTAGTGYPSAAPIMPSSSSYEITDVSLSTKSIAYDDAMWDLMKKSVGGGGSKNILKFNGTQLRTSNVTTNYSSYFQEIVPNSQWTNLQSAICFPYQPTMSPNGDNLGSCWGNGIYQAQFSVDGVQFPQLPVGSGDSLYPATALPELIMSASNCVRDACRANNGNTMITPSMYPLPQSTAGNGTAYPTTPNATSCSYVYPAGASNCNQFVNLPPPSEPSNSCTALYPYPPATTTAEFGERTGRAAYFCSYGFNFTSMENGKMVQGIDTRGRQCNIQVRQSNKITTNTTQPAVLVVQAVAAQYELDMDTGSLSVRLQ